MPDKKLIVEIGKGFLSYKKFKNFSIFLFFATILIFLLFFQPSTILGCLL